MPYIMLHLEKEEGDKLLCFLAGLFRNMAQKYELITFGRMNADVFCACVRHNVNTEILERAVEEVQKKLASYRSNYLLEISVGVYLIDEPSLSVEENSIFVRPWRDRSVRASMESI